ncbi:1-aminocyclopropane-1-carboxylate synthase [Sesamum angolense]|uniref:1-aminocyclopropane-1-carboxylate synthase n=1 Tax=Sesamum angolense TaxID=2727404 RepID=A0AAE1X3N3_9LAMI|nr:1-aminocyclopropane-1-carboxylate synthase [Sesamum angolense]
MRSHLQLSHDLIAEWMKKNPAALFRGPEGAAAFKNIASFQELPEFRNAVAKMMEKVRGGKVSFDPDRIVMAGGVRGAMEMAMFCLADPGDAFLVPSPWYPGFQVTIEALEDAYENARKANIKVKGLVITNPTNPLGTTMDRATLTSLLTFINDRQIHILCDEVYAGTVFRSPEFVSFSEIIEEVECNRNLVHVLYGLAKDMGLSGFRVGVVYSYNDTVMNLCQSAARLGRAHDTFVKGLEKVGIKCLESNAGLYCWMDLRHLLKEPTFEAEMSLWKTMINVFKLTVLPDHRFTATSPAGSEFALQKKGYSLPEDSSTSSSAEKGKLENKKGKDSEVYYIQTTVADHIFQELVLLHRQKKHGAFCKRNIKAVQSKKGAQMLSNTSPIYEPHSYESTRGPVMAMAQEARSLQLPRLKNTTSKENDDRLTTNSSCRGSLRSLSTRKTTQEAIPFKNLLES